MCYDSMKSNVVRKKETVFMGIFSKLFKSYSEKQIKAITPLANKVEALAEKYGIGVLVSDERLKNITDAKTYAETLRDFSRYDSYKGLSIVDEPFTSYYGAKYYEERKLEAYAGRSTVANYYHNTFGYINLNIMV